MMATQQRHQAWLDNVAAHLARADDVVGLVAFGSTAETSRVDEWSDHDIALVVAEGAQNHYRDGATWLPTPRALVLSTVEHHGGGKAMYSDGHLVEWGVDTVDGLRGWLVDDYRVLFDRGGVSEVMREIASRRSPAHEPDFERDVAVFLFAIMHGVGRHRRGETISAGAIVRGDAVTSLQKAVTSALTPAMPWSVDRLDCLRRVEAHYPDIAGSIARACALPIEECAQELLMVAVKHLGVSPHHVSRHALDSVTDRLGWPPLI